MEGANLYLRTVDTTSKPNLISMIGYLIGAGPFFESSLPF